MGANKSISYNVSFNRSSSLYYVGERVTGILYFHNKTKKFTYKKLFVELVGELGYTTEKTNLKHDGLGHYRTEQQTLHHHVTLLEIRQEIIYPKDTENEVILNPGEYSWPFEFLLPQNLPPSLSPSQNSSLFIKYYVRLSVDIPRFTRNAAQTYPLTIFPIVDLYNVDGGRQSVALARRNNQQLEFKVYLHHRGILPGRTILLDIDVKNPQKLKIEKTEVIFRQYQFISEDDREKTIFQMDIEELSNFNEVELHKTVNLPILYNHLAPTCNHRVQTNHSTIETQVSYELQLNVKVHTMSSTMKFTIPIIVGTESSREENENNEMPISYAEAVNETNLPPSYETAIATLV